MKESLSKLENDAKELLSKLHNVVSGLQNNVKELLSKLQNGINNPVSH